MNSENPGACYQAEPTAQAYVQMDSMDSKEAIGIDSDHVYKYMADVEHVELFGNIEKSVNFAFTRATL